MGHDMTPMAGRVTDGQEDWLVFVPCFLQSLLSPGIPVNGIIGVLEQIGAGLVLKFVGHKKDLWLIGLIC
jgi:hypothetical protein